MDFIVDVNLPKKFAFFNSPHFVHVVDMDDSMSDTDLWHLAISENRVILTKDTDFYNRSMTSQRRPKVVLFQLGNMTLRQLHSYFTDNWLTIVHAISQCDLVVAYPEHIRSVS